MLIVQLELMKALGDGTRLAIFERVCVREFTVNELKSQFACRSPRSRSTSGF